MSVTTTTTTILFSYTFAEINNAVQLHSARVAQAMAKIEGVSNIDYFAISDDEANTIVSLMNAGADILFNKLGKLTFGISDAIVLSEIVASCKIVNKTAHNGNTPNAMDRQLEEGIINYILSEWFAQKGLTVQMQLFGAKLVVNLREVTRLSGDLRKPVI